MEIPSPRPPSLCPFVRPSYSPSACPSYPSNNHQSSINQWNKHLTSQSDNELINVQFFLSYNYWDLFPKFCTVNLLKDHSGNYKIKRMFFMFNTLFSHSTWSQFIDEMKTLEYKNLVVIGNPLADTPTNDVSQGETINIKPSIWPSDFVEVPCHELLFQVSDHYPFFILAIRCNRKQETVSIPKYGLK